MWDGEHVPAEATEDVLAGERSSLPRATASLFDTNNHSLEANSIADDDSRRIRSIETGTPTVCMLSISRAFHPSPEGTDSPDVTGERRGRWPIMGSEDDAPIWNTGFRWLCLDAKAKALMRTPCALVGERWASTFLWETCSRRRYCARPLLSFMSL